MLEEDDLARLGMRTLLAVGQGSDSPSKVVVMQWKGGGDAAPVALVGKGVVFDTGGEDLRLRHRLRLPTYRPSPTSLTPPTRHRPTSRSADRRSTEASTPTRTSAAEGG